MWGDVVLKNNFEVNKIIQIYDQFDCQKLLGVHKSSSNQAVLGELGRFPLFIDIIINLFKYYKEFFKTTSPHISLPYSIIYITTDSIKPEKPPLDFHIPP
jgi:hypothetical protein